MSKSEPVRVRDVMKVDFDEIDGLATVSDALRDMQHIETKALVVRRRNEDDEFGIVELEDIATEVLAKNLKIMDAAAIALARDNNIPIIVFSIRENGGIVRTIEGGGQYSVVQGV